MDVRERIARTRALVAASREIITRARERIDGAEVALAWVAGRLPLPDAHGTEDQYMAAMERGEAYAQQQVIDREVGRTLRGLDADPV